MTSYARAAEGLQGTAPEHKLYTLILITRDAPPDQHHARADAGAAATAADGSSCSFVLLGMKKRGFGEGKWNGFGGKVEVGETLVDSARRELLEEACVDCTDLTRRGIVMFHFVDSNKLMEVHIFVGSKLAGGVPSETEEMRPCWFAYSDIPYNIMWPDDEYWLPMVLQDGKSFVAHSTFKGKDEILTFDAEEVDVAVLNDGDRDGPVQAFQDVVAKGAHKLNSKQNPAQ